MKVLVIGGTGFIGKRLVDYLLKEGCDVIVATSGRTPNPFGDAVMSVRFDRYDPISMEKELSSPPYFDLVYDQICFSPNDARMAVEAFSGRIGRYIFVSSAAVYNTAKEEFNEKDFDPLALKVREGSMSDLGYSEGKRQAEAFLFQNAPFPVSAARFPIVVGHDDSTSRFQSQVEEIIEGRRIVIPKPCGRRTYVWVDDAGRFLSWLGLQEKTGYYNASSSEKIDANEFIQIVGKSLGKKPTVIEDRSEGDISTYHIEHDSTLSVRKAEKDGFSFTPLKEWLPQEAKAVKSQ